MTTDTFGFAKSFLKTAPEIQSLVTKATKGGWEMDRFLDALKVTSWWKRRSDAQKRFDIARRENPKEIATQVQRASQAIARLAVSMGLKLNRANLMSLATRQVRNDLTDAEMRYLVGGTFKGGGTTGLVTRTRADLVEMARNYGVGTSSAMVNGQIKSVLQGVRTVDDYETYYRDTAKQHYAGAAKMLDAGFTLRQILDPYIAAAAQELGVSATAIDITDGKWNAPAQYTGGDKKAPERMMTQDEWIKTIRTDTRYGFDQSQNGQRAASILAGELMQAFGARR